MSWNREQAKQLSDRILSYSRAAECEVGLQQTHQAHSRSAANEVTTAGTARDLDISITSRDGQRSGTIHLSDADPGALKAAVARSEQLMKAASADPEYVEGLGPQKYPELHTFHLETEKAGALERRGALKRATEVAVAQNLLSSAFWQTNARWAAIANKKGNFGFFSSTSAGFSATVRTSDGSGSGWAGGSSPRFSEVPAAAIVDRAVNKAITSAKPRALSPGKYTVILEPQAVADLLQNLLMGFSKRSADEGRSFLSKPGGGSRLGEKMFAEAISVRSDPFDGRLTSHAWAGGGGGGGAGRPGGFLGFGGFGGGDFQGLPTQKTSWVENGEIKALTVDRYWARKTKTVPVPYSGSLVMSGGNAKLEDLIADTKQGLLITHFWYIRTVNPQNVELTGLTRDGVWWIEDGKIRYPVNNFRFNQSPVNVLKNVEALGPAVPTGATLGFGSTAMIAPPLRARDFLFTSVSEAI
jgi:predicted Zn-dependent protease